MNKSYFDVGVALAFGVLAWVLRKLELPAVPILLGLVLGNMTETNFRRALLISNGDPSIFFSSVYCIVFLIFILVAVGTIVRGKVTEHRASQPVAAHKEGAVDFQGYRADCITGLALEFFDRRDRTKPFFMTISHIEPHHQNDRGHYEGPEGSKEKYKDFVLPGDLQALGGNAAEEYPDYLGQCASLDENLGRLVARLKEEGLYDDTVIIFASDHGSHFKTRNQDGHLCGYDDYKRSGHDGSLHVPLVIAGGPYRGGAAVQELVSTASLPKTILALAGLDVGEAMIGENLFDVVEKKNDNRPNEVFAQISESRGGRCLRTPEYLYGVYAPGLHGGMAASAPAYADDYLYDLEADPWQLNNVAAHPDYAQVNAGLRERLLGWIERVEGHRPEITD